MVIGLCTTMCPVTELIQRKRHATVSVFEKEDSLFVKEYRRSAAGKEIAADEVRTYEALQMTLDHLVGLLDVYKHGHSWLVTTNFVTDRLRAIRQDVVVQQLSWKLSIPLLEKIVRYHVYISYVLEGEKPRDFDPVLNQSLLSTYMSSLLSAFEVASLESADDVLSNYDEFQSYYILWNINNTACINEALVQAKSEMTCNALHTARLLHLRNYYRCFQSLERLSFLQACCLIHEFTRMRVEFLYVLNVAYSSKVIAFPLTKLKKWLKFDSIEDLQKVLDVLKYRFKDEAIFFDKSRSKVDINKQQFRELTRQLSFVELVENCDGSNLSPVDIVNGVK